MFNNLYSAANEIRTLLMPFAFILCVIGIGEMGWRAGSDSRVILGVLLKCIVIVTLIAGYPDIMNGGQASFIELRNKFTNARDAKFVQLLGSTVQNQPSEAITDIGKIVPAAIGYFFQGIGRFMLLVLRFFQEFAIAGLIAVSPLLIGFLFFSYTQSVGVHFGVTSLTVLLWHVAICLVDITIQLISDVLFLPITTGGLVQTAQNMIVVQNWLHFPFIMAFAAFLTVFFYFSVPFVASAVMKGLSGTTASLQAGIHGTMQAAGLAVGTGLTVAGAATTFGGSAAAQAAIEGTKFAAGTASSAGRIASDFSGVGGEFLQAGQGSESGGDIPAPPPLTPAPVGKEMNSESHPSLTAHQTAPNSFAVVDQAKGTISHHRSNIFTPQVAQAAFNSHSAHAKPLQAVPPPYLHPLTPKAINPSKAMKFSAIDAITNNLVAARFWMVLAIMFAGAAIASPYFTVLAMRAKEKVVILDPGGTLIYAPLLGFEEAGQLHAYHVRLACLAFLQRNPIGPDLSDLLKRLYLDPARKKAALLYQAQNAEFKERQIHQKVEIIKIDILDTRKINDGSGQSYEAVTVRAEGNLIRTGTVNKLELREPVKFTIEFLFIRNPDLLGNGRLPLVVQDFKYKESPL